MHDVGGNIISLKCYKTQKLWTVFKNSCHTTCTSYFSQRCGKIYDDESQHEKGRTNFSSWLAGIELHGREIIVVGSWMIWSPWTHNEKEQNYRVYLQIIFHTVLFYAQELNIENRATHTQNILSPSLNLTGNLCT